MSAKKPAQMKVVLLGSSSSGKTSLCQRYIRGKYSDAGFPATVAASFGAKVVQVKNVPISLSIWDTAGSERYESISKSYYRGAHAAIICYDVTRADNFEKVKFWVTEVRTNEPECAIFICGCKEDLVSVSGKTREVKVRDVESYVEEVHAEGWVESSAMTGLNVDKIFVLVAEHFVRQGKHLLSLPSKDETVQLNQNTRKAKCCQ